MSEYKVYPSVDANHNFPDPIVRALSSHERFNKRFADTSWIKGSLPAGTDLNTFTTPGLYRITSETPTNLPPLTGTSTSASGFLTVSNIISSSATWAIQEYVRYGNYNERWWRISRNTTGAWGNWQRLVGATELEDALTSINMSVTEADWRRGVIPAGVDLNTLHTAGVYRVSSEQPKNMPPFVNPTLAPTGFLTVTNIKSTNAVWSQQEFVRYGPTPERWWRISSNITGGWNPWTRIPNEILSEGIKNDLLVQDFTRRRGGIKKVSTGVVALRFDHGLANFNSKIRPVLERLKLPYSLALCSGQWERTENVGVTPAMVNSWVVGGLAEIWNHSKDHGSGDNSEKQWKAAIDDGLSELRTQLPAAQIDGFAIPGSSGTSFGGFVSGRTVEEFFNTDGGKYLLSKHAVVSGYLPGYRVLDGLVRQGQGHVTIDSATLSAVTTRVKAVQSSNMGLQLMLHPSLVDTEGYATTAVVTSMLEYIAAERDAGRLTVLGPYDALLAEYTIMPPYRGLWQGGGDMDTWRTNMRGTWEVRDATGYARPANLPANLQASVPVLITIDATDGGHTVQTVKVTGNGQSEWFRVSKVYTGVGSANWSTWRRVDSTLRPRLDDGTDLDTLRLQAHEGSFSITTAQALTLTNLPVPGAFGTLHVMSSLDGLASQFFHQLTAGGGATKLWWRMVNHATTFTWGEWQLLTREEGESLTRVPIILTTGGGPSQVTEQASIHARLPINIPVKADRWRAHFRNYNYRDAQTYTGELSVSGVGFGTAALNGGRPTGQFSGTPSVVMGSTKSPTNAAVFSTPWVDKPIEAATDYLLSYAYTGVSGQKSYLAVGGGWLSSNTDALLTADSTLIRQQYMPLDVFLEIEVDGATEVVAYYGDSLTAGVSAELPVYDSYPMRHARANGHLPVIYAASGSTMNLWTNSASGQITRWASYTKPSKLYWSMGSNDVFQPVDIATLRTRFAAAWAVLTGATSRNVILTTILPRLNATAAAETVRKEWNRILMDELPGNALMTIDSAAALTDNTGGVLDERWRATPTDLHLNKQGYAKFASTL